MRLAYEFLDMRNMFLLCFLTRHDYPSLVEGESHGILLLLVKRDEIVRVCDQHSNEMVIVRKHVTKYKQIIWSNFSANLRVVAVKLLKLTQFGIRCSLFHVTATKILYFSSVCVRGRFLLTMDMMKVTFLDV